MSPYVPLVLGAALTLLLVAPASARPLDGGMLGGFRLGGSLPEGQPVVDEIMVKNTITFVLGSDGPAPALPFDTEDEYDVPFEPVDDSAMLFAEIEGDIPGNGAVVPEPTSLLMLGSGLMLAARRLRRH